MIGILHAADLHLDSPFSGFSSAEGAKYRALQRKLPGKLVELANERECDLLVLAGDVFDSEEVHPETVRCLQNALAAFRGQVFISPGNHDPYTETSVWEQCQWPENVRIFREDYECMTLEALGCQVHGGAFLQEHCEVLLPRVKRQGYIQIGVYHGDCVTVSPYRRIEKEEIGFSGLDYLALGHIHKRSMPTRQGKTWYGWPGVTMGRGFDEQGLCGALYVQVEEGVCKAEFLPIENPTYVTLTVAPDMPLQIPKGSERFHCRIRFVGQRDPVDVPRLMKEYEDCFLSLQIVDETTPLPDLWEACGDGTLRGLALDALREEAEPETAELAAQYLLAALEGREEP